MLQLLLLHFRVVLYFIQSIVIWLIIDLSYGWNLKWSAYMLTLIQLVLIWEFSLTCLHEFYSILIWWVLHNYSYCTEIFTVKIYNAYRHFLWLIFAHVFHVPRHNYIQISVINEISDRHEFNQFPYCAIISIICIPS